MLLDGTSFSPEDFWKKYDAGEFGQPSLPGKPITDINAPAFQKWMKDVQALSAEEQVKAVAEKMQELNPEFDGKLQPTIGEGIVLSIAFISDNVTDICPLRAFTSLSFLECYGSAPGKGMLADLSPLKGRSLRGLWCSNTKIADLSPLKDMPIKRLTCQFTSVSDLSPLAGMPLMHLRCTATKVANLAPLEGMTLTELQIEETLVSDLSPLKGMQLTSVAFSGTPVSDISPLQGMPLQNLICSQHVTDFSVIKQMPLKMLYLDFKPDRDTDLVRSITTLETINNKPAADFWKEVEEKQQGKKLGFQMPGFDQWAKDVAAMPADQQVEAVSKKLVELNPGFDGKVLNNSMSKDVITHLVLETDNISDISPVRAVPQLAYLVCHSKDSVGQLSDLSPLKGLPILELNLNGNPKVKDLAAIGSIRLEALSCMKTSVSDLSPLREMPLKKLWLHGSPVSDLAPLAGMQLILFNGCETKVSDLSPLKDMPLKDLAIDITPVADLSPLKAMPLETFHGNFTQVADLSPLRGKSLKTLRCDFKPERDTELLRSITTLETINDKPAADFWKEVEEQQKTAK